MQHIIPLHNTSLFKIPGTEMIFFQLIQFSWAEEQPGCWAVHHLGRSWPPRGVCSAPRRYGWLAGGGGGWSWSSYCLWLHFLPTPKLLLPGILIRLLSIQGHLHQLVQHSSLKKNDIFLIPKFIHFVYTCIYKCFFIWTHNKANFHFYMNFFTTSQWSLHTLIACITENIKSLLSRTILNNSPLSNVTIIINSTVEKFTGKWIWLVCDQIFWKALSLHKIWSRDQTSSYTCEPFHLLMLCHI